MEVPPSPSSNIMQTYCIPLKDTREGFRTSRIQVKSDKQNIIITLFKHPKILSFQTNLLNISRLKNSNKEQPTQTVFEVIFEKNTCDCQTKESDNLQTDMKKMPSQQIVKKSSAEQNSHCNTITQSMLTGKLLDPLEDSTNQYIINLQMKLHEYQQGNLLKKKIEDQNQQTLTSGPAAAYRLELTNRQSQTDPEIIPSRVSKLNEQLFQLKDTMQKMYEDNLVLIQLKSDSSKIIKAQQNQITQLHSEISRVMLENSRMKSYHTILSRSILNEPVRERTSLNGSKGSLGTVKVKELEALHEENRVLRLYIEALKAQQFPHQFKTENIDKNYEKELKKKEDQIAKLQEDLSQFQQRQRNLQKQYEASLNKVIQLQKRLENTSSQSQRKQDYHNEDTSQMINALNAECSILKSEQSLRSLKDHVDLEIQNKKLQQKIMILSKQIETQRQYVNILKAQNQSLILQLNKSSPSKQEEHSKLNYKRLLEMYQQQSKQLKSLEYNINNLQQIVKEYQQIIDEESGDQDTQFNYRVCQYIEIINERMEYVDAYFNKSFLAQRQQDSLYLDEIIYELKKERDRRALAQSKLQRLSYTLMQYQKQIIEKTTKISDLNFTILQFQSKQQLSNSYSQQYSSIFSDKLKYEYRPSADFRKTRYDRTPIEHSEEDTINESKIRQHDQQSNRLKKMSKTSRTSKGQTQTLKSLLNERNLTSKQKWLLMSYTIQILQKNPDIWKFEITPSNIIVKSNGKEVEIDVSFMDTDPMFASPEELIETKSENSIVWRIAIIIDHIVHRIPFFNSVQAIVDPKLPYKFEAKEGEYQGLRKVLTKALTKNSHLRISMNKFIIGLKSQFVNNYY